MLRQSSMSLIVLGAGLLLVLAIPNSAEAQSCEGCFDGWFGTEYCEQCTEGPCIDDCQWDPQGNCYGQNSCSPAAGIFLQGAPKLAELVPSFTEDAAASAEVLSPSTALVWNCQGEAIGLVTGLSDTPHYERFVGGEKPEWVQRRETELLMLTTLLGN